MLTVAEARARILNQVQPLSTETIALESAAGRVLARALTATEDIPPFVNSSMDGYAVRARDVALASRAHPVTLPVSGDIPAGGDFPRPLPAGTAMRIMTGAPLPADADAVVPVEDTDGSREQIAGPPPAYVSFYQAVGSGVNVRPVGQDMRAGEVVLPAGAALGPAEIGVLAALGQARVEVHRRPRVAIFSTGDELRPAEATLGPGQIRDTNGYALAAAVERYGGEVVRLGIARDDLAEVRAKLLAACTAKADVIVSSAGVSVGAYDVVKAAVEAEGALEFWRVNMRPGKPVAFGRVRDVPFFGLPGNPVSALVSFEVFARPAILKLAGHRGWEKPSVGVTLAEDLRSDGRESYLRVIITRQGAEHIARSTGNQGSAVLTSMVKANGLLIVPAGVTHVKAGDKLSAWWLTEAGVIEGET
jgi:molybdopterin molybdotransferase